MFWKLKDFFRKISVLHFKIGMSKYVELEIGNNCSVYNINKTILGKNNSVFIGNNVGLNNCYFYIKGTNNNIIVKDRVRSSFLSFWIEGDYNNIIIGEDSIFGSKCQLAACEGTSIHIGKDCLFSHDIFIRTTDSHSIIDSNHNRINYAHNIIIDNHVWIGMQCLILKGAHIGANSIVGARSIVSSTLQCTNNVIICGSPARIIKNGINWDKAYLDK